MARPREFDPDEALQTAIELFWEKGYYDTSVDEVVRRTGVAKYGIYGTFGGKRELFLKALEQYGRDRHRGVQRPIRQPDASLPQVLDFFKRAAKLTTDESHRRGCLLENTGVELGARDPEIGKIVANFFADLAKVLRKCLKRAVDKGELDEATDVSAIATYLATEFRTMLMLAASGHSRRDIERHLEVALRVLS